MRWWSLDELRNASTARFAPRKLPELYADLLSSGIPTTPLDTGV